MRRNHDAGLLLRGALLANATFSGLSGLLFCVFGRSIARFTGDVPPALVIGVGVALIVFAATLVRSASRAKLRASEAWLAILLDAGWVAASAVLIVFRPVALTPTGAWAVAIVALFVLDFALAQALGVRRLVAGRAAVG